MLKVGLIALAALLVECEAASARVIADECLFSFTSQPGAPAFETYRADHFNGPVQPPRVTSGDARRYRTAIRAGARTGVNFGGHYTVVGWGCGSSCLEWAVVDRRTGAVHFDPRYRYVSTVHVGPETPSSEGTDRSFNALRFRRDSTMLVVQGAPNEEEGREGLTYLEWSGRGSRKLAFVPAEKLCSARTPSAARAEPSLVSAKTTVSKLLDAIRRGDQAGFAESASKFVIMATPDFGAPVSWEDAQRTFGPCSLQSLSEPKPLDGVPAQIVTATMTCPAPLPAGVLTFDFMADGKQVHGVYPGGIDRFYPKVRKGRDAQP